MSQERIRNFCIIAHIDHGKSTLADRFLELTGTVSKREMKEQLLDSMDLERERGITIKLTPVRMHYQSQFDRRPTQTDAQTDADELLYSDITYKIRGAVFAVRKELGLGHKESIYHKALAQEFSVRGLQFDNEQRIPTLYKGENVGTYTPDFVVEDKVLVELKALPEIGRPQQEQVWSYLKGSSYKLALLINFGTIDVDIRRVVYDTARSSQRESASSPRTSAQIENYILNLIDTPGHVDFTYEVSRSLAAVEGAVLLVDATQGIQAQTIANLHLALEQNLEIIPLVNKIDLPNAMIERTREEIVQLLGCKPDDILLVSGKTGQGVPELLDAIVARIPPPNGTSEPLRALIFDSTYDDYRGVIAYIRCVDGSIQKGDVMHLMATDRESEVLEVGVFTPKHTPIDALHAGEIGYVVTGLKDLRACRVGDTITSGVIGHVSGVKALPGYKEVKPMVFAGVFPKSADDTERLRDGLLRLRLSDAALVMEPEHSHALGFGFRCGFLGLLHLDIVQERLKREHRLDIVVTVPSVAYRMQKTSGESLIIRSPQELPDPSHIRLLEEPWVKLDLICPHESIGGLMQLAQERRGVYLNTEYLGGGTTQRALLHYEMPLAQILVDFYDRVKSVTQGYGSLAYEFLVYRAAAIVRLDILVAEDVQEALATLVYEDEAYRVGRRVVEVLKEKIPRQAFEVKLQAAIGGKIIAAERIPAMRKDVLAKLSGGDVTRKRKLLEIQKKGKKKMAAMGRGSVDIPSDAFLAVLKR